MSCIHTHSKRKENKIRSLRKQSIFIGYSDTSKAYKIYFPGFNNIDISRDVAFNEDSVYNKSRRIHVEEPEEAKSPKIHDTTMNEEIQEED